MSAGAHEHLNLQEETARLVDAFGQMASSWSPGAGPGAGGPPQTCEHDGTPPLPAACRICPLCQLIARVGQTRPEIVSHLADAAAALAAAFSAIAAPRPTPEPASDAHQHTEHIDITD